MKAANRANMVRVLTAHHFGGQDIHTCEDPVAAAPVKPSRLVIALARHVVEVRDLEAGGSVTSTFPTADKVLHIEHCKTGNYIATLEGTLRKAKHRQNPNIRPENRASVRVYTNWETGTEPMRARIAGRVTPSRCETNCLEMIEIPARSAPTGLACCQTTGNLLVSSYRVLDLYTYSVHRHESSHTTYIDFKESELSLCLSFSPLYVRICEELVAASGKDALLVCRVCPKGSRAKEVELEDKETKPQTRSDDGGLSMKRLLKQERDILVGKKSSKNLPLPFPVTVNLPSVVAERASRGNCSPSSGIVHQTNPFVADPVDVKVSVTCSWQLGAEVESLLRLQLAGDPSGNVGEQFGSLVIQPVYAFGEVANGRGLDPKVWPLHSPHRNHLYGVAVLIATQQEGHLYHFAMDGHVSSQPCVSMYPFTAPVTTVALEPCALHALTETGLETYTLRSYHRTLAKLQNVSLPEDDPISLIGLRPFLGVKELLVTDWQLVLLASPDGSPGSPPESKSNLWTVYSLKLPGPEVLFSDMLAVGESHKVASPTTYRQLLMEAHCIIARFDLLYPSIPKGVIPPSRECTYSALKSLYSKSCVLLGDYLVISDEKDEIQLATQWYCRSGLPLNEVIERINKNVAQCRRPGETNENDENAQQRVRRARCLFLFQLLTHCRKKRDGCYRNEYIEAIHKDDQTCFLLANSALDEFEKGLPPNTVENATNYLGFLVLNSPILIDYALQRTLELMEKLTTTQTEQKDALPALALVALLVQQGNFVCDNVNKVALALRGIENDDFVKVGANFWEILIDQHNKNLTTFSDVAAVLMEHKPSAMASLLAKLVTDNTLSLEKLPKMLISLMSSRVGKSSRLSHVFQRFLELFFDSYFSQAEPPAEMNEATHEALKILVRTYLSDLQMSQSPNSNSNSGYRPSRFILLENSRHSFLDVMPPFDNAVRLGASLSEQTSLPKNTSSEASRLVADTRSLSLKKLQSLLCSGRLTEACVKETLMFVAGNPQLYGSLSLQVLCMQLPEGLNILVECCPKAILRYGQEVLAPEKWRLLIDALIQKIENLAYSGARLTEKEDQSQDDSTSGTGTITPRSDEAEAGSGSAESSRSSDTETNKLMPVYDDVLADVLEYLSHQLTVEEFWELLSTTRAFNTPCVIPPLKNNPAKGSSVTLVRSVLEPNEEDAVSKYHEYLINCLHNQNAKMVRECLVTAGKTALAELYP